MGRAGRELLGKGVARDARKAFRAVGSEGERIRTYAQRAFSWPAIASVMKRAYAWGLDGAEKPDCVVCSVRKEYVMGTKMVSFRYAFLGQSNPFSSRTCANTGACN